MAKNSLDKFISEIRKIWGPLNTETIENSRRLFTELVNAPATEPWLSELIHNPPESKELYRDPEHGFLILAYSENEGLYRVPHDHGSGWVMYGVQTGEMEMGTYMRAVDQKGRLHLVNRETFRMRPGDCKVYLPGDIHHTRCTSKSVLVLRFTSCDLRDEEKEGRMIKYVDYQK